jgi:hypothetical protein
VEIGAGCTIGAGTGIGMIRIENNVRTLPGTTVSPYLARIRAGSIVGYDPPSVKLPDAVSPLTVQTHHQPRVIIAPVDRNDDWA